MSYDNDLYRQMFENSRGDVPTSIIKLTDLPPDQTQNIYNSKMAEYRDNLAEQITAPLTTFGALDLSRRLASQIPQVKQIKQLLTQGGEYYDKVKMALDNEQFKAFKDNPTSFLENSSQDIKTRMNSFLDESINKIQPQAQELVDNIGNKLTSINDMINNPIDAGLTQVEGMISRNVPENFSSYLETAKSYLPTSLTGNSANASSDPKQFYDDDDDDEFYDSKNMIEEGAEAMDEFRDDSLFWKQLGPSSLSQKTVSDLSGNSLLDTITDQTATANNITENLSKLGNVANIDTSLDGASTFLKTATGDALPEVASTLAIGDAIPVLGALFDLGSIGAIIGEAVDNYQDKNAEQKAEEIQQQREDAIQQDISQEQSELINQGRQQQAQNQALSNQQIQYSKPLPISQVA